MEDIKYYNDDGECSCEDSECMIIKSKHETLIKFEDTPWGRFVKGIETPKQFKETKKKFEDLGLVIGDKKEKGDTK